MEESSYIDQESMEQAPKQPIVIKYGLIMGVVLIVYSLFLFYAGMTQDTAMSLISYVIYAAFLVLAMREYRNLNGGLMTFGQGMGVGVLASLVSSIIGGVFFFVYFTFVDDTLLTNLIDSIMLQLQQTPGMTDEALDMTLSIYEKMFTPIGYLGMSLFGGLLTGTIISLIVSAIMKKNPE